MPFRLRDGFYLAALLVTARLLLGASCGRPVQSVQVGGLFTLPIYATAPPNDPRLFVVERGGTIRVLDANRNQLATPFLDIHTQVNQSGEEGLLGMAFAPNYATSGQFYVYYNNLAGDSVLSRFLRSAGNPNVANPASEHVVLVVDQPAGGFYHKAGTIAFSPIDGMLYWALGDGGTPNNENNLAQNTGSLLGKMLRINVNGGPTSGYTIPPDNPFLGPDGVLDEIWSIGFRNPFRWSFDRQLGDLWIGDVGQNLREEVDFEPADDPGGRNYGWNVQEGSLCNFPQAGLPCESPAAPNRFTFPFYEYTHDNGNCAITGGVVYRGSQSFLRGAYLFSDSCSDRIWSLGGTAVALQDLSNLLAPTNGQVFSTVVAFGEDAAGEVYIVSYGNGRVFQIK